MPDSVGNEINNYRRFEECIAKIFSEAEYSTVSNIVLPNNKGEIDIIAEKDGRKYCVEVKYAQVTERGMNQIRVKAKDNGMLPILVTAQSIEEFAVRNNVPLRNELVATLPYSVEDIEPCEGAIEINSLQHDNHTESLIEEMDLCQAGNPMARKYEILCHKLLENIFSEDLALWKEQQKSNSELYRFDLLWTLSLFCVIIPSLTLVRL